MALTLIRPFRQIVVSFTVNVTDDFGIQGVSSNSVQPGEFTSEQSKTDKLMIFLQTKTCLLRQ